MEVYYSHDATLAYVTDGIHLTIHEVRDWPSVSTQSIEAHRHALNTDYRRIAATRIQGNRRPHADPH